MPAIDQALYVRGLTVSEEIEYSLVYEKLYEPDASVYTGKAEVCAMFFDALPEQLPLLDTIIVAIIEAVVENIVAQDGKMLRLRIFNAKGEWYNSKWIVEAVIHSSPFPWAVVIPLILVALIVIGFTLITYNVKDMDWGEALVAAGFGIGILLLLFAFGAAGKERADRKKQERKD